MAWVIVQKSHSGPYVVLRSLDNTPTWNSASRYRPIQYFPRLNVDDAIAFANSIGIQVAPLHETLGSWEPGRYVSNPFSIDTHTYNTLRGKINAESAARNPRAKKRAEKKENRTNQDRGITAVRAPRLS